MIRFKNKRTTTLAYLKGSNQSKICEQQRSFKVRQPKHTAIQRRTSVSTKPTKSSFINSIHYLVFYLIYIIFSSVTSAKIDNSNTFDILRLNDSTEFTNISKFSKLNNLKNVIVQSDHLNSTSSTSSINSSINSFNNGSNSAYYLLNKLNNLTIHNQIKLDNYNFNNKSTKEVLNNQQSFIDLSILNESIKSVHSTRDLSIHNYDLINRTKIKKTHHRRSLSNDKATNLTQHKFTIKPTLSPLLPTKLSTFKPLIINVNGNVDDRNLATNVLLNESNRDLNTTHQLTKQQLEYSFAIKITISILLLLLIISTIVGNLFVICAIMLDKNLQTPQNYLVLSLAVADLAVALLVMPPCMISEINQRWVLGSEMCVFWNLLDVFSCTASILHLLAIALDRYWSVSSLHYSQGRSLQRMMCAIAGIWSAAVIVSIPPLLGVKDPEYESRVQSGKCLMSQDLGYQIFATMSTFYVPSVIIIFLYWKIYQVARKRIRNKPGNQASKHRTLPKEDKTDSLKRTNINTISSRVTIASTVVDLPTQNTSSTQNTNSDQSKEVKQSKSTNDKHKDKSRELNSIKELRKLKESKDFKELKETKKLKKSCQSDLGLKGNDKVYDSNSIKLKQLIECECDELNCKNLNNLQSTDDLDYRISLVNNVKHSDKIDDQLIAKANDKHQQEQQKDKNQKSLIEQSVKNDKSRKSSSKQSTVSSTDAEPIVSKKRRFQTKYKYIDEDDKDEVNDLNNLNCLNDRNNNKFIQSDNELDKLKRKIDQLDQIDDSLIDNLSKNNLELDNSKLADKTQYRNHSNDLHKMKHLNNELRQTNSIELETQLDLDSGMNNSNASRTNNQPNAQSAEQQSRQANNKNSIQAIASTATAIKAKNHSNLMAKKERRAAKVLAIITGIFMACWLPFFIHALLSALFPKSYEISNFLYSIFQWLGYFNSSVNPLIYTIFSVEFRNGFAKLLHKITRCNS